MLERIINFLLGWLTRKQPDPVDGFDKLVKHLQEEVEANKQRIDECDRDRQELREQAVELKSEVTELRHEMARLKDKFEECEQDRGDFAKRLQDLESKVS